MVRFKKIFITFLMYLILPLNVFAYSDYIIAGGENIGIELHSKGVLVVGLYNIGDRSPGSEAGLKIGDTIVSINNNEITNIDELVSTINDIELDYVNVSYIRDSILNNTNLKLYKDDNGVKTGLYVKDSISGIGTLTYIDPSTLIFGALGHEIIDSSGTKLEVDNGTIYPSNVVGIEKSIDGVPGEKNARYDSSNIIGNVFENTKHGVFGKYSDSISMNNLYKVAKVENIKKGKAKIRTVIEDDKIEEFEINILKINSSNKQTTKNILFEITDDRLLNMTGGIIQGMSGSPIIQDNYIIGAVTHVVVDNPKRGYGIFITNMLEEGEN